MFQRGLTQIERFAVGGDVGQLRQRRIVLVTHLIILAAVAALLSVCTVFEAAADVLVWPVAAALVAVTLWLLWSWHLVGRSVFDPYGLFLLAAVLFNGGQAYLEVFGLNRDDLILGLFLFSPATVARAFAIVTCALAALHLGALLSINTTARARSRPPRVPGPSSHYLRSCRVVGLALLLVSVVPSLQMTKARFDTAYEGGTVRCIVRSQGSD